MKTIHVIYLLVTIFLVVIALLFSTEPPQFVTGQPHPELKTMLKGGSSMATNSNTNILAYLFGLCATGLLCLFLILGARRRESLDGIRPWLIISSIVYLLVFTCMYLSDAHYVSSGHQEFVLGWPSPTAWMIYVMWSAPALFVLLYIFKFREWILTEEDEERFAELVKQRRTKES